MYPKFWKHTDALNVMNLGAEHRSVPFCAREALCSIESSRPSHNGVSGRMQIYVGLRGSFSGIPADECGTNVFGFISIVLPSEAYRACFCLLPGSIIIGGTHVLRAHASKSLANSALHS